MPPAGGLLPPNRLTSCLQHEDFCHQAGELHASNGRTFATKRVDFTPPTGGLLPPNWWTSCLQQEDFCHPEGGLHATRPVDFMPPHRWTLCHQVAGLHASNRRILPPSRWASCLQQEGVCGQSEGPHASQEDFCHQAGELHATKLTVSERNMDQAMISATVRAQAEHKRLCTM